MIRQLRQGHSLCSQKVGLDVGLISKKEKFTLSNNILRWGGGGETGIRTLGRLAPTTVFETAPFDHSGTCP